MASSANDRPQDDSANRRRAARNRKIEPPRKAPQTERGPTHSPYFNGPQYQRMMVHVHRGKGAKDRYIPLPQSTLLMLRAFWLTHRHRTFVFPADGRDHRYGRPAKRTGTGSEPVPFASHVFRVAISDNRILECIETSVTYRYTPSGTKSALTRTVDG